MTTRPLGLLPSASTLLAALGASLLVACSGPSDDSGGTDTGVSDAVCEDPTDPPCVDEMILDLSLHDDKVSDGEVATTTDGADFVTTIDASAGGYSNSANNPWVYVKFSRDGATRVDIDDETALESMDWDLSLRRFILRLNGGDSGPSCVGAAVLGEGYTYENLTSIPDGVAYQMDDYYTDDCTIVNDSSGLEGSPQVVLGPWWDYESCLSTTGQPFLVQLADGGVIKLRVETYYDGNGQEECNSSGSTTASGGFITVRWAYMN